jgi:hypothetical protein
MISKWLMVTPVMQSWGEGGMILIRARAGPT